MTTTPLTNAPSACLLIDFENTQPEDLHLLRGRPVKIKVFVGAKQEKLPMKFATELQKFNEHAEYIQCGACGPNAVDFLIAYYLGRLTAIDTKMEYFIVSKDCGFDPLIQHLNSRKITCRRVTSMTQVLTKAPAPISVAKAPAPVTVNDKARAFLESLKNPKATRPRTLKTLESAIRARFKNGMQEGEATQIIGLLLKTGMVHEVKGKVTYSLPINETARGTKKP